jgi:hypothetical protein
MHDPIRRGKHLAATWPDRGAPALYGRSDPPLTAVALHAYAPCSKHLLAPGNGCSARRAPVCRQVRRSTDREPFDIPLDIGRARRDGLWPVGWCSLMRIW